MLGSPDGTGCDYLFLMVGIELTNLEGHVAKMEESRSAFKILTGTPTVKRPFEGLRLRREENIRIYIKKIKELD